MNICNICIQILIIIDGYLKLILTSWPAVILILFLFVLLRHREAINKFIERIIHLGPQGIDTMPPISKTTQDLAKPEINTRKREEGALVTYKITSALPGTMSFDFLKDWKVWFLIENQERKKYKAYIKIKFISDGYKEQVKEGYYGGTKEWNLNTLTRIIAPGLGIPEKIREMAEQRKKIEIKIFCTIKDENNELIEEKLPIGYVYDYENKNWYYEP